jgi:hypothetical protein
MRTFRDAAGTEWTVFEVRRVNDETNWAYLPRGFRSGWLCFESSTAGKRRLSPVPDGWKMLEPSDLELMLRRASPVGKSPRGTTNDGLSAERNTDRDSGAPA